MKKLVSISFIGLIAFGSFAQVDRSEAPKPQPNPKIEINIPDVVTTDNGLKVIVVENHKLPKVSFQLFVDYPIMSEGDKVGLGDIFGQLLSSGTTSVPKDQFDSDVDYMGASVSTTARGFFASSLKKHTPKLLELLSDMVQNPAFPEDEFERIVNQNISALEQEKSSPDAMASNVADIVNYGKNHPYGEITTEETLNNISLQDVKDHYNKFFIPNMAYLVIVGDVTKEEAIAYTNKYFGEWKKGNIVEQQQFKSPVSQGNNVYFVDKPGAVQSRISITHNVDLKPGHEDAIKLRVMNQILGGGSFSARLMSNLREDKAYTYGCYSRISPDILKGSFNAGGNFRNEVTDSAIVQIMMEIEKIAQEQVTDKELELVKNSMTGSFARSLESSQTIARFALNTVRYNLPKDYYANYLTKLEAITKEELLDVAKQYLRPQNLNIVVVGNEEVVESLGKFDTNAGISLKDSEGNDKMMLKAVPNGVTAEKIFNDFIYKSLSVTNQEDYEKKMKKVGYIAKSYSAYIEAYGADMFMTNYEGKPNKTASILKIKSPQGNMTAQKEYFNGETGGSFVMGAGKSTYEGDELTDKKEGVFMFNQLAYMDAEKYEVELMGIDELDEKEYYKIKISEKDESDFVIDYYSVEDGWLYMTESFGTDEEGNAFNRKMINDDYREVKKGIMMSHTMKIVNMGQSMEFTLDEVKIKKKPKSAAFDGVFN